MRVFSLFFVVDTLLVQRIDAHLAGGVQNLARSAEHAYMHNSSFGVVKKSEITGLGLVYKVNRYAGLCLIGGIPG